LEGRGFKSHLILDGRGVKAMSGLISSPNPGSFNNRKGSKYRQPNGSQQKYFKNNLKLLDLDNTTVYCYDLN
jgi:hypothetical protein